MFSMAVSALAKSLIVATVSLHPAAAPPAHYTARPGDTLSSIARHEYGNAADWPALWWINRRTVPNPDLIAAGQRLALSTWHPRQAWLDRAARAAIPVPAPARPASAPTAAVTATTGQRGQGPAPAPGRGDLARADLHRGAGQLPGVRDRPRIRRKRPGRQPGLRRGRPLPVPAQHLAEPGVLRAAARRTRQRAERGIPAGIRPVGHQPMGTLRRVLTAAAGAPAGPGGPGPAAPARQPRPGSPGPAAPARQPRPGSPGPAVPARQSRPGSPGPAAPARPARPATSDARPPPHNRARMAMTFSPLAGRCALAVICECERGLR